MTELLTAAQMRAIEQAAIAAGEVTGLELMERAGRGVVEAIFEEWPALAPSWGPAPKPPEFTGQDEEGHRAVVLCGPGNNGGDGFVVARLLREAGWEVEVFLYGDAEKLPPDARVNYERWGEIGVVRPFVSGWMKDVHRPALLIDALFGIGLSRPLNDDLVDCLWELLDFQPKWKPLKKRAKKRKSAKKKPKKAIEMRSVSIDVPSGFCAHSGRLLTGEPEEVLNMPQQSRRWPRFMALAFSADIVITFHRPKTGHYLSHLSVMGKKLVTKDLRPLLYLDPVMMSDDRVTVISPNRSRLNMETTTRFLDLPKRNGHKYSYGHALILSGGVGKGGAARLAARGALRVGAGAVTVGCPPAALIENAAQLNAVMLRKITDVDALTEALQDTRINALCLGPGMGLGARAAELLAACLELTRPGLDPGSHAHGAGGGPGSGPGRGVVLDADALTLLARDQVLFAKLHDRCILTPHAGEFARLFPDIAEKLDAPAAKGPAYSKVDATREAAKRAGCVVLFKGPDTVIADPSGRCSINASVYERSAPWLATAGSGDVLAGFITGLLARGFAPMQAAETGAWLHTECALSFGPGLIAEDLPEELPKVFRSLGI